MLKSRFAQRRGDRISIFVVPGGLRIDTNAQGGRSLRGLGIGKIGMEHVEASRGDGAIRIGRLDGVENNIDPRIARDMRTHLPSEAMPSPDHVADFLWRKLKCAAVGRV